MPSRADLSAAQESKSGHTLLMIAALQGDTVVVKHQLACGAAVNAKDDEGRTALMFAVANSHAEIVKTLLHAEARVNARARDGSTALMLAAANGNVEITRMLLEAGAKTGYRYVSSRATAASLAVQKGHTEILELLHNRVTGK